MRAALLLFILLVSNFAFADGGMWIREDRWNLHPESNQYAIIDYNDGYERLGLTVEFAASSKGTNAVWVVPIPSNPTRADIKLIDGFPVPSGRSIRDSARESVNLASLAAVVYGTFPLSIPLALFPIILLRGTLTSFGASMGMDGSSYYDGISIFQRVTLGGVTSDLVGTSDPSELENYLQSKGVVLAGEYKLILENYVEKDYSFVVTYITDWQKFQLQKGSRDYYGNYRSSETTPITLRIGFPSEKPYFPLKLTSMYGDRVIPITIYMMGNYMPQLYSGLGGGIKADYFRNGNVVDNRNYYVQQSEYYDSSGNYIGPAIEEFFRPGRSLSNLDYTKFTINEPSANFKDDLWFTAGLPMNFEVKKVIADNFWVVLILIMAMTSAVASVAAGRLAFKGGSIGDMRLAMHGLWNFTTMIGFVLATFFWKIRNLDEKTKKQLVAKGLSVYDERKVVYAVVFYVLFIIAIVILWLLLGWVAG
ncbi:MAG: hypothetical protein ABH863_00865 [Candidatus Micrarchaeota archaeon]